MIRFTTARVEYEMPARERSRETYPYSVHAESEETPASATC